MSKGKRNRATRHAHQIAHDHTQFVEGQWFGQVGTAGSGDEPPIARELIRRYNAAAPSLRACPHLHEDRDQASFWVEAVPELLACALCTPQIAAEEERRANTCCLFCGEHVPVKGVTVTVGGRVLRAGVCEACEQEAGLEALSAGR